jgi:hypothetical protein
MESIEEVLIMEEEETYPDADAAPGTKMPAAVDEFATEAVATAALGLALKGV